MVANILLKTHPRPWGWGQKVKSYIFLNVVMLQIKGNCAQITMEANMLSLLTPLTPGWDQKVKFIFFSESGHVAYQIKVKVV